MHRLLPNIITFSRIPLAVIIFKKIVSQSFGWALILYLIAETTDWLDGTIARRFKLQTKFGAIFEHVADTFMNTVVIAGFTQNGMLPLWLLIFGFLYMLSTWMIPKRMRRFALIDKYIAIRPVMYGALLVLIPIVLSLQLESRIYPFAILTLYFLVGIKWKWDRVLYYFMPLVRR